MENMPRVEAIIFYFLLMLCNLKEHATYKATLIDPIEKRLEELHSKSGAESGNERGKECVEKNHWPSPD